MKNRIRAIAILTLLAAAVVYFNSKRIHTLVQRVEYLQPTNRPLPMLSTPKQRLDSYTPQRGDIKYRVVPPPVISTDTTTQWSLYTSRDYGFSFIFPPDSKIDSTEQLGYQLPPNQAYKGSRDNFQIEITNNKSAYYLLFLNYPNFSVANTTTTASSVLTNNGIKMTKKILASTNPDFASSQIIEYDFEKNSKKFIWYGTFDSQDFESINNFESVVQSMKFQ